MNRPTAAALAALLLTLAGCTAQEETEKIPVSHATIDAEVRQMLNHAARSWTDNNLDGFMSGYLDSSSLRFAHPKGITLGYDTVKARYANSIDKSDLKFTDLDVTALAPDAAVVFGRFHNTTKDGDYATGLFTLLVRKIDDQWKITHDHSSDLPADTPR